VIEVVRRIRFERIEATNKQTVESAA